LTKNIRTVQMNTSIYLLSYICLIWFSFNLLLADAYNDDFQYNFDESNFVDSQYVELSRLKRQKPPTTPAGSLLSQCANCQYCKYCQYCGYCKTCPTDPKLIKANGPCSFCKNCQYCTYCPYCSMCPPTPAPK